MAAASEETKRSKSGLVVVGAWLMRTGTLSLKVALEKVLHGECYHMATLAQNPHHAEFWQRLMRDEVSDEELRDFMSNFSAAVDFPPSAFYQRLARVFPDAKVVLSVRDPRSWYRSVNSTIVQVLELTGSFPLAYVRLPIGPIAALAKVRPTILKLLDHFFGPGFDLTDEAAMVRRFDQHVREVRAAVPAERLLVFEARDGWGPLCRHLGVPEPDCPYPHENSTLERAGTIRALRRVRAGSWALVVVLAAAAVFAGVRTLRGGNA